MCIQLHEIWRMYDKTRLAFTAFFLSRHCERALLVPGFRTAARRCSYSKGLMCPFFFRSISTGKGLAFPFVWKDNPPASVDQYRGLGANSGKLCSTNITSNLKQLRWWEAVKQQGRVLKWLIYILKTTADYGTKLGQLRCIVKECQMRYPAVKSAKYSLQMMTNRIQTRYSESFEV